MLSGGVLKLQLGQSFNYENQQTYIITFSVRDQFLTALQKKDLTINITNVNEGPTISTVKDIIYFNEDKVSSARLLRFTSTVYLVGLT